ncbi:hypothetical protein BJY01DRAFT_260231 [Aspergillus pseudoustus]|uniref:Fe2OG dioxygenase domain-containing protein n=1 Tax=Aspergillus pseudoustus TaxID=1810923 RepID=A0ABR4IX19_9EURO
MAAKEPPIIDFAPFYGSDSSSKDKLVRELRQACEEFGFFQIINHGIPPDLQDSILTQSKALFELPIEVKEVYNKDGNPFNRGYERLRSQNFEKRTAGDLKEGFYLGTNRSVDDPDVVARKFGQGPNTYPAELGAEFPRVVERYHAALTELAEGILRMLARTLDLEDGAFQAFCERPVAVLRLLHYPPQEPDASDLERGIGAHTDFGAITILLQDTTGGLQVWNNLTSTWVDVTPIAGAYVVNLGNMMMRWTNDRYLSNLHRVINKSGKERFSVPFFFSGNPDYTIRCLPSCQGEQGAKYPPITVGDWMTGRYADTYGKGNGGIGELRREPGVNSGGV